jgi:hypothetical protein
MNRLASKPGLIVAKVAKKSAGQGEGKMGNRKKGKQTASIKAQTVIRRETSQLPARE